MPREDNALQTTDNVTLHGWLYTPEASSPTPLPCLVMSHGFTAVKEIFLDILAAHFPSSPPISCLVYDNRGFGASENHPIRSGSPSFERSSFTDPFHGSQACPPDTTCQAC